jgi:hypothetical protein
MKLRAPSLPELASFYSKIFKVDQISLENQKLKRDDNIESLENTLSFLKTLILNYTSLKKQVFGMIQVKSNQVDYQKQMVSVLQRYEEKSNALYKDIIAVNETNS